eukprot:scaffold128961_cov45-Phaeocystis_antarctica.AAC.1
MEHEATRHVAKRLVSTLRKAGQQEEAEAVADKHRLGVSRINTPRVPASCVSYNGQTVFVDALQPFAYSVKLVAVHRTCAERSQRGRRKLGAAPEGQRVGRLFKTFTRATGRLQPFRPAHRM